MPRSLTVIPSAIPAVSVILPTYNERDNIASLVRRLDALLPSPAEILVVDDGSPDGTAREVEIVSNDLPNVRAIVRAERGLTGAIQRGIDESRGEVVVWMDADFSMPPETVPELIARVRAGQDAAIGSRYVGNPAPSSTSEKRRLIALHQGLTRRLNRGLTAVLGADFHDWTSGFIAIRGPLIRPLRLRGDYGEYFIDLMARLVARDARLVEVHYRPAPRRHGESKTAAGWASFLRLGVRYVRAAAAARRTIRRRAG